MDEIVTSYSINSFNPTPLPYLTPLQCQSQWVANLRNQSFFQIALAVLIVMIESSFWSHFQGKDWTSACNNQTCSKTWKYLINIWVGVIYDLTFLPTVRKPFEISSRTTSGDCSQHPPTSLVPARLPAVDHHNCHSSSSAGIPSTPSRSCQNLASHPTTISLTSFLPMQLSYQVGVICVLFSSPSDSLFLLSSWQVCQISKESSCQEENW